MKRFNLPDLGEGLPDAEIHEWYVKVGDTVVLDQPIVSMETAKAVVDVPSPQEGVIARLYGNPGDIIKTGAPLVEFEEAASDQGTVVGKLMESVVDYEEEVIDAPSKKQTIKATPAIRLLAKKHGIDLNTIKATGEHGVITKSDLDNAIAQKNMLPEGFSPLKGTRRAMLVSMTQSHQEVVPVSIFDDACLGESANIGDITVRLIRAIAYAIQKEPALNAWYNTTHAATRCFESLHLGLAMDSQEGLFVPVIHHAEQQSDEALRALINQYKKDVLNRTISADKLKGATFTLSNFGKFAGRYASPIIVPPQVAILAVGRIFTKPALVNGALHERSYIPLSLSFDHRAITGGEATRFLGAIIESLEEKAGE